MVTLHLRGGPTGPSSLTYRTSLSAHSASEWAEESTNLVRTQLLRRWLTARMELARATQNYLEASAVIEADCARPSVSHLDELALENTFITVNTHLGTLQGDEQRLWKTRIILQGLRNKSRVLTPVNLLPPEILTDIFLIAVESDRATRATLAQQLRENGKDSAISARLRRPDLATVISSVNVWWRRIAIRTRALWAHIDLTESGAHKSIPFARAKLWLERARGAPLHVSINTTSTAESIVDAWSILPLLRTHETHFRSLDLALTQSNEVHAVMARWLEDGSPNSLRSLAISVPRSPQQEDSPHALPPGMMSREQRNSFFEPLTSLDLDGIYLSWGGAAFRNLVDLRLSRLTDQVCPNVEQFVGILSGSPQLRTLWLRHMTIRVGARMNFVPVQLANLEILGLEHVDPQGLCLLLPLLAPGPSLYVKIAAYTRDPGEVGDALTDLFARSRVEKLHLRTFVNPAQVPRMLSCLQHLRIFTCEELNIGDEFFEAMTHGPISADGPPTNAQEGNTSGNLCPNLSKLDLQRCRLSIEALRSMLTSRSIPRLSITGCYMMACGASDEVPRLMEEIEQCLNSSAQDVCLYDNSLEIHD